MQKTVGRFLPEIPIQDFLIVTNVKYLDIVRTQLASLHPDFSGQVLVEPEGKNTAPAIALAIRFLEQNRELSPDEELLVSPADHLIAPKNRFLETIKQALVLARSGKIVTFGVRPTRPETGYGYIKATRQVNERAFPIEEFVEKPPFALASAFVENGEYFWNAGLFLFTASTFWQECDSCASPLASWQGQSVEEIKQTFAQIPSLSFDCAIMEKTKQSILMPLDLTWSDVGSWDSVHEVLEKDSEQNVTLGNIHAVDTKNSLLLGGKRLVSTLGVEDMLVVDTEDALFIAKKGESQRVKEFVEIFKAKGMKEVIEHRLIHRPWGSYTVLEEGLRYKIKKIEVHAGAQLSLQLHYHRSEHWIVIQGTAKVTIGEKEQLLHENESIYVPKSSLHRLENPGKVTLEMIEVQVGEYVGEDDIVRFEDIYGRVSSKTFC